MKFIKSVIHEMTLVTWPTAKETRRDTTTVIITSLIFAAYFALADWVILLLLKDGMAFIEKQKDAEAIFITKDKKVYVSSGLKKTFELIPDTGYKLATLK